MSNKNFDTTLKKYLYIIMDVLEYLCKTFSNLNYIL